MVEHDAGLVAELDELMFVVERRELFVSEVRGQRYFCKARRQDDLLLQVVRVDAEDNETVTKR